MIQPVQTTLDNKTITLYQAEDKNAPVMILNLYVECGQEIIQALHWKSPACHLVIVSHIAWDQELSPWPHSWIVVPDDDFTGQGPQYLAWIETTLCDWIASVTGPVSRWIIGGYSMGGMFALYAASMSSRFMGAVCISGSVWYPDFVSFIETHPIPETLQVVYLSTGSTESNVKNPVLRTTMDHMKALYAFYEEKGLDVKFQINPGNHFQHAIHRVVIAIDWILAQEPFK